MECEEEPGEEVVGGDDGSVESVADASSESVEAGAGGEGILDSWNGELDSLRGSEWYGAIPEDRRELFESGLNAKYKSWSSGYGKKFESLASDRKAFEEEMSRRESSAARDLEMAQKLWYGDSDVDPRIADLEAKNQKLMSDLEEVRGTSKQLRGDAFEAKVKATYGDIYHNDEAIMKWADLVMGGLSQEDAADFVRHKYTLSEGAPDPAQPATRNPPPSVAAASLGNDAGVERPNKLDGMSMEDAFRRAKRDAIREDEAAGLM